MATNTTCGGCGGHGSVPTVLCPACAGERVVYESSEWRSGRLHPGARARTHTNTHTHTATHNITIPPGGVDFKVQLPGHGNQSPLRAAGDVIVAVRPLPHPRFRLEGRDLHFDAEISLVDALVGLSRELRFLDGSSVQVKFDLSATGGASQRPVHPLRSRSLPPPAGAGYDLILPGMGMPNSVNASASGQLIVHFDVKFPRCARLPACALRRARLLTAPTAAPQTPVGAAEADPGGCDWRGGGCGAAGRDQVGRGGSQPGRVLHGDASGGAAVGAALRGAGAAAGGGDAGARAQREGAVGGEAEEAVLGAVAGEVRDLLAKAVAAV